MCAQWPGLQRGHADYKSIAVFSAGIVILREQTIFLATLSPSWGITHSPNHKLILPGSTTSQVTKGMGVDSMAGLFCAGEAIPVATCWK